MSKKKVLIQIDPDDQASVFDSIVAIDSGIDHLVHHTSVLPAQVAAMVHGAIFTRGPDDLKSTALFFGGTDVARAQALVDVAKECFIGPMRVSLMSDPNGCNTTAAAAVLSAGQHIDFSGKTITILAATGPVGQRIAQLFGLLAADSTPVADVRICSRKQSRAESHCKSLSEESLSGKSLSGKSPVVNFTPFETGSAEQSLAAVAGADVVFAAGAAGIELLPASWQANAPAVVVDLNAVPPAGIAGVDAQQRGAVLGETIAYGAIGVGRLKMKIHRRCIESLFESNDRVLELDQIYQVGREMIDR